MPNAEKVGAVAEIAEQFSNVLRRRHHRVPRSDRQAGHRPAPCARPRHHVRGRQEHPDQARRRRGRRHDRRQPARGPTAIAFVKGDPVEAAKGLRDFASANPLLVIKGGVLDGRSLSTRPRSARSPISSRARCCWPSWPVPSRRCPPRAAGLFQAPLSQMARLAKALEEKKPAQAAEAPPRPCRGASRGRRGTRGGDRTRRGGRRRGSRRSRRQPTEAPPKHHRETPAEPAE